MALPWLIAAGAAALLGIGAHESAKETNEKAQRIARRAQENYESAKASLEAEQKLTEEAIVALGNSKKDVLEDSMKDFLVNYEKIKQVQLRQTGGLNELSKFVIDEHGALAVQKMSDIYGSAFASGTAGAVGGAVAALAISGALPVVSGALTAAGGAVAAGNLAAAAGLVGGAALQFAASATPLAFIAAPITLFTGISADLKADENLEKARSMEAKADAAIEKMKTSELMCNAIAERTKMFDDLLDDLDSMFSVCVGLLGGVIDGKSAVLRQRGKLTDGDFAEEELNLIAVTRSLAGAVKSVIDTPILDKDGAITDESERIHGEISGKMDNFSKSVDLVRSVDYSAFRVAATAYPSFASGARRFGVEPKNASDVFTSLMHFLGKTLLFILSATVRMLSAAWNLPVVGFLLKCLVSVSIFFGGAILSSEMGIDRDSIGEKIFFGIMLLLMYLPFSKSKADSYRRDAEKGDAEAQCNLGLCYYKGDGVHKDHAEAAKWFRKAAEQGHAGAQCGIGICYYKGDGVHKDYAEAAKWFRKAAEQGHAGAQYNLGSCYYNANGVHKDHAEAAKWLRASAEQGNKDAEEVLKKLCL